MSWRDAEGPVVEVDGRVFLSLKMSEALQFPGKRFLSALDSLRA